MGRKDRKERGRFCRVEKERIEKQDIKWTTLWEGFWWEPSCWILACTPRFH
jgi:hypothetical protein